MLVIGFFRDFFEGYGNLVNFITQPIKELSDLMGFDVSILSLLSVSLGAFLLVVLILHLVHLINPVG